MVKFASCVLVLLAAVFVAEGIEIAPQRIPGTGELFAGLRIPRNIIPNDLRCKKNGVYPNPKDCTAYYVCLNGTSQDRKCPEGMKYDSYRRCTFEKDADCGASPHAGGDKLTCQKPYGKFPYKEDCHKYIVCIEAIPDLRTCPERQWYQVSVGCIVAKECPKSPERPDGRPNQLTDILVD